MKLERVQTKTAVLQRSDPEWRTSSHAVAEVPVVFLALEAGGCVGIGGTAAHPYSAPPEVLREQIEQVVVPAIEGTNLEEARYRCRTLSSEVRSRVVLALDLAFNDLLGRLADVPCEVLWGGTCRDEVITIRMVGLKEPEELPGAVSPLLTEGFRAIKLKIGDGVDRDVRRIELLRDAFGTDLDIMVDANGAYGAEQAIDLGRRLFDLGVSLLEQPTPYEDLNALRRVTEATDIAVVADQAVRTFDDVLAVCQTGAADAIGIKVSKLGSVDECRRVIAVCEAFEIDVHLGGTAAPSVVDSASCRLALSQPAIVPHCEVSESLALVGGPHGGIVYEDGYARSDGLVGLGTPGWEELPGS